MDEHHESHHAVPQCEGHDHRQGEQQPDVLVGPIGGHCDHRHPGKHSGRHEHAVPLVLRPAGTDLLLGGEIELLPPKFQAVVETPTCAAAIDALEYPAVARQGIELFFGERRPDLIASLEVVEAVVRHVVADIPEAESRHGGQESDPPEDVVQEAAFEEGTVAGVVADEEQAHDAGGDEQRAHDLEPQRGERDHQGDAAGEHREIYGERHEGPQITCIFEGVEQGLATRAGRGISLRRTEWLHVDVLPARLPRGADIGYYLTPAGNAVTLK